MSRLHSPTSRVRASFVREVLWKCGEEVLWKCGGEVLGSVRKNPPAHAAFSHRARASLLHYPLHHLCITFASPLHHLCITLELPRNYLGITYRNYLGVTLE